MISLPQLPYDPTPAAFYGGSNHLVELTQSAITTFLRCPQKFVFQYMMRLRNKGISIPLLIGSAVHAGLEVMLEPSNRDKLDHPNTLAAALEAGDKEFTKLDDKPDLVLGREDKINHARAVAHACIEGWWIVNGTEIKGWNLLATEMNVRSAPGATVDTDLVHRLAGKLDAIVQTPDKKVWLLEHKTRSNLYSLDVVGLELDFQTMFYLILCHIHQKTDGAPVPSGFLYDAIQKPQHRMNKAGDWHELKERMVAAMAETPERYFLMSPVEVGKATLELMWSNLIKIVSAMDRLSPDTVYRNQTACNDFGGCPFRNLCFAGADAARPDEVLTLSGIEQFRIQEDLHSELGSESDTGSE